MKFNNEIRSCFNKIYDTCKARNLYDIKKYGHRKLSLMKQENIRCALRIKRDDYSLTELKGILDRLCGYCFKYGGYCDSCPLIISHLRCYELLEYIHMETSTTKKQFAKYHKVWCKMLGLWQKEWV